MSDQTIGNKYERERERGEKVLEVDIETGQSPGKTGLHLVCAGLHYAGTFNPHSREVGLHNHTL